ncbi:MAG: leucine--tRNA ligase [Nanoarchaeota archaeon]|nr:leucine--tRNA ligase [Nanoarchaeota archaeon]
MAKTDYDFKKIESRWQKNWTSEKVFESKKSKKPKFYVLDMFPYPSGTGLHMGHAFVFSLGDIFARFKRLQGFNVLYPIGYDALGLPAENAAIKAGVHPKEYTNKSIANFMKQQKAMGWSYDWSRMVNTSSPEFYKWDQWIFLKMYEKGLAYRKKSSVNWCPKCQTVLANEQVHDGKCWRHEDTNVEVKHLEQWYLKITDYAQELLEGLEKLNWSDNAKLRQRNWIGRSEGSEILFEINGKPWSVFTTRPDTIYGVTFLVVSAQHSELINLVSEEQEGEVKKFLKKLKGVSEKQMEEAEKEGVFTGSYALNPINGEKIPVYAGNFVVADYGSGMVMAVPAHDKRDFEFAEKYGIPVKVVVEPKDYEIYERDGQIPQAYEGEGTLVNSGEFNGMESVKAKVEITKFLEKKKLGKKTIQFRLRDWLISRQRYWGTPIPMVYCDECGIVPVEEKNLPIVLPDKVTFGKGNPLTTNEKWVNTNCPKCGGKARRETDTMDTFANSSWYYLRYADPENDKKIFNSDDVNYWAPIDQYIGGPEHITAHLIYVRFYTKFLRDLGLLEFDEPALRYFTQGIIHGSDGEKMSKSGGNVVEPFETIKNFGADSLRLALVSLASPDKDTNWDEKIVDGSHRFLRRVYDYFSNFKPDKTAAKTESKVNMTIKGVSEDVENFRHNLAVIKLRQLFDYLSVNGSDKKNAEKFLLMLHIYCPFVTEELWNKMGNKGFISLAKWPEVDGKKIDARFEKEDENVRKVASDINNIKKVLNKDKVKVSLYAVPSEVELFRNAIDTIKTLSGSAVLEVYAVNDAKVKSGEVDPEGKAKKAKPGKPGIYLE